MMCIQPKFTLLLPAALFAVMLAAAAPADDLRAADQFLCAPASATLCRADGTCESGPPWKWNIPDFVVLDLAGKLMRTTAGSPAPRQTPISALSRRDGLVIVQGNEQGRAFGVVIEEAIGAFSASVVREGLAVTLFGSCTTLSPTAAPEVKK